MLRSNNFSGFDTNYLVAYELCTKLKAYVCVFTLNIEFIGSVCICNLKF